MPSDTNIKKYTLGKNSEDWKSGFAKDITFVVTEDCNLRCKYCYIGEKHSNRRMSFEITRKAVDYLLDHPDLFPEPSVIFNFVGGEPFLEMELIDEISDYIKISMYRKNHPWFNSHMFNFSTNGLLYHTENVQKYIHKNKECLSIGISVDGNKIKHDLQRIYKDGKGSYDDVIKNVPLWLSQFPNAGTKATFAHDDLPYLKDSVLDLWAKGVKIVNANVVFEDVWEEGDDVILEEQLKNLADEIIHLGLYKEYRCSFFDERIGNPLTESEHERNWCGAGKMLAIDYLGDFYPCLRFMPYSLQHKKAIKIGSIEEGLRLDKIRPFLALTTDVQSKLDCVKCEVASGCAWCQGWNYDSADGGTIYQRSTSICKMHKARVRASNYYWSTIKEKKNIKNNNGTIDWKKWLYLIISDSSVEHCYYQSREKAGKIMSIGTLRKAIHFAEREFYQPVVLYPKEGLPQEYSKELSGLKRLDIHLNEVNGEMLTTASNINCDGDSMPDNCYLNRIVHVRREQLGNLSEHVIRILDSSDRVNLTMHGVNQFSDKEIEEYERQLECIADFLFKRITVDIKKEVNVLTDLINLEEMEGCKAGQSSLAVSPDGEFYICPAFYFGGFEPIGNLMNGFQLISRELFSLEYMPLCKKCTALHCRRCVFLSKQSTGEYNVASRNQCLISHIERKISRRLLEKLPPSEFIQNKLDRLPVLEYDDPLKLFG